MTKTGNEEKDPAPPEWMRATGFVFVAATVIPIVVGIHVGAHCGHETTGGLVGAVCGLALGVWLAIRPAWKNADKEDRHRRR